MTSEVTVMVRRTRKWFLAVALALAALAAAASGTQAATTVDSIRFKGLVAEAAYAQSTDCSYTNAGNFAFANRATERGAGSQKQVDVSMYVDTYNGCGEQPISIFYICSADNATVNISSNLGGATVNAMLTCQDVNSGETCQVSKSETLQGIGDITFVAYHEITHSRSFMTTITFNGRSRGALVTSASLTGCGVSLTAQDVSYAALSATNQGVISITRS
jgi:hypothetical protein